MTKGAPALIQGRAKSGLTWISPSVLHHRSTLVSSKGSHERAGQISVWVPTECNSSVRSGCFAVVSHHDQVLINAKLVTAEHGTCRSTH